MEALRPEDPRGAGAYRLIARLGAGGMGRVFLGRSARGRMVAVKLVHPELARDPDFRRRFRHEVEAARRVGGEWTAAVLDADTDSETPWVATAYVPGPSLQEVVDLHGPLPEASVLALAGALARALQAVHGNDLIHRDLKPSNVLVTIDGPRLIDFGIARSVDTGVATRTGTLIGSPGYMSPEQVRGEPLTPASDVFSLGAVLAYAATGRPPFGGGEGGVHAQLFRVASEPADLDGLTGPVRELVDRCLAKEPGDRPAVDDLLGDPPGDGTWLPPEVVAELGRHAARLLDVEDPHTGAPDPPAAAPPSPAAPVPSPAAPAAPAPGPAAPAPAPLPPPGPPPGGTRVAPGAGERSRMPLYLAMGAAAAIGVVLAGLLFVLTQSGEKGDGRAGRDAPAGQGGSGRAETADAREARDGGDRKSGDVPGGMLGSWEHDTSPAPETNGHLRRITVEQGAVGDQVLTLISANEIRLCIHKGVLREGGTTLRVDLGLDLSEPVGCAKKSTAVLTLDGGKVRLVHEGATATLSRVQGRSIPEQYRGTWEAVVGRPVPGATSPDRRVFDLTAGPVGTEAVKITNIPGKVGGSSCSAMATLLSVEREFVLYSSRLLTPGDECRLAGMQRLVPGPDGSLRWENGSGAHSALRRA